MSNHRIAVISDIHGNIPALEAVLADLRLMAPDEVLVGGDLVGRGPQGSAVIAEIRSRRWRAVRGNHEDYLLDFHHRRVPDEWWHLDEWAAARWMVRDLTDADLAWLDGLPLTLGSSQASGLLLAHGSPRSHSEGLGPWTSDRKLESQMANLPESILVCAHTHRPMHRRLASGMVVNTGSVGLPFNGDRRAQYCVLDWQGAEWSVELRAVEYDLEKIFEVYDTTGFSRDGGVTARLLKLELLHAAPFLVPFLKWTEALGTPPTPDRIDSFLDLYDPGEPVHEFFIRLDAAAREMGNHSR